MSVLKVALLQKLPKNTQVENMKAGIDFCKKAKENGADIVLFPEMWNVGYEIADEIEKLKSSAISVCGDFVNNFKNLAKELDMAIGITFLEKYEPLPKNTVCLFDRKGNLAIHYSKVHTCDFGDERRLTAGDEFFVANLDTEKGCVKVGVMICFDREFPESARVLMLKGAEIILVPNACPMEINRLSQLRSRAFENMVGIATANYPKGKSDCNGHSTAFDGVAYLPDEDSRDMCIFEADENEGVFYVNFDMGVLRAYRKDEVHGNAYRHPKKYGIIVAERIDEPFVRANYRD